MSNEVGFQYSGEELEAVANGRNYYRWICEEFAPYFGRRVVEVGAGIGTFSEFVMESPGVESLVSVEPAENVYPKLTQRFARNQRVRVIKGSIDEIDLRNDADSLVAVNVLEHVENDRAFLCAASRIVVKGGHLLLFVPAHQALHGSLDRAFDHYRRYSKSTLSSALESAGWTALKIRNVNIAGIIPWWIAGKLLRKKTIGQAEMKIFDRLVIPVVRRLETVVEPFVGQSLLAIARNG